MRNTDGIRYAVYIIQHHGFSNYFFTRSPFQPHQLITGTVCNIIMITLFLRKNMVKQSIILSCKCC